MIALTAAVRIFVATEPTDGRKGFDALVALVLGSMNLDPHSGHWFVFVNRRADLLRVLVWDRHGWCLVAKRLELGTFRRPSATGSARAREIDPAELAMILEGIDAPTVTRRKRFTLPRAPSPNNSQFT